MTQKLYKGIIYMKSAVHLRSLVILLVILLGAYVLLQSMNTKEGFWWHRRRPWWGRPWWRRPWWGYPRSVPPYPYSWSVWPYGGMNDGYTY